MSGGPDLELQAAVYVALVADPTLTGLLAAGRIFQDVPANQSPPYVTIGESQNVPDLADCIDGSEIFLTMHVITRGGGYALAKKIVAAMDDVLHEAELELPAHRLVLMERGGARFFKEVDSLTAHSVVTYRALVEPTD